MPPGFMHRLPDLERTVRRYAFAVLLCLAAAIAAIYSLNWDAKGWYSQRWPHSVLFPGLMLASLYAAAGQHLRENRAVPRPLTLLAAFVLPLLVLAGHVVYNPDWVISWLLFPVGAMWLTLSPFVPSGSGVDSNAREQQFWWFAHRSTVTAIVAIAGYLLIWLGLFAIRTSMSQLFGVELGDIFDKWIQPVVGCLFVPVYWLSTLPTIEEVERDAAGPPDFLSRAIGFIGEFLLIPFLLIYSGILVAYAVQSLVSQRLPQNTVGWMVLSYAITGAATWLVVSPSFMRDHWLVRMFRRVWFWMTLVPLALFAIATFVRVDAYGLTQDRMLLVAGGLWATFLTFAFLLRRGDIRLIPAVAAGLLLILAIGPWNLRNLPIAQQSARLEALLSLPGREGASFPPVWTDQQVSEAAGLMQFLQYERRADSLSPFAPANPEPLQTVLAKYGIKTASSNYQAVSEALLAMGYEYPGTVNATVNWDQATTLYRPAAAEAVDVSGTPMMLDAISLLAGVDVTQGSATFAVDITEPRLELKIPGIPDVDVDLTDWLARQPTEQTVNWKEPAAIVDPWVDIASAGVSYRIVVTSLEFWPVGHKGSRKPAVRLINGILFTSSPPPSP